MKPESPSSTNDFVVPAQDRAEIVDALYRFGAGQDLGDRVLFESAFDGETAVLFALVEAQHLPMGDHGRHLLLKNIYMLKLSRDGRRWVTDEMKIENVWMHGDPTVLFPATGITGKAE